MSDNNNPIEDNPIIPENIRQAAGKIGDNLSNATDSISNVTDQVDQKLDDGIKMAEEKLDNFLGGLNKFLDKF